MILSLDTSGPLFSIAILNNKCLEMREFEANKDQSERMIIEIQALLKEPPRLVVHPSREQERVVGHGHGRPLRRARRRGP